MDLFLFDPFIKCWILQCYYKVPDSPNIDILCWVFGNFDVWHWSFWNIDIWLYNSDIGIGIFEILIFDTVVAAKHAAIPNQICYLPIRLQ